MTTLVSALNTAFVPTGTSFIAQVTSGSAYLQRRNTSSQPWAEVRGGPITGEAVIVDNPVIGASYRFVAQTTNAVVQAEE